MLLTEEEEGQGSRGAEGKKEIPSATGDKPLDLSIGFPLCPSAPLPLCLFTDPLVLHLDLRQKLAPILAAIQPPDGFSNDAPRGASEAEFKKHLERWFGGYIHEGAEVRQKESSSPCTADFSYIDKTSGLHVDIEVDEPYI